MQFILPPCSVLLQGWRECKSALLRLLVALDINLNAYTSLKLWDLGLSRRSLCSLLSYGMQHHQIRLACSAVYIYRRCSAVGTRRATRRCTSLHRLHSIKSLKTIRFGTTELHRLMDTTRTKQLVLLLRIRERPGVQISATNCSLPWLFSHSRQVPTQCLPSLHANNPITTRIIIRATERDAK